MSPSGGGALNQFGIDFATAGKTWTQTLCQQDSDQDGLSNGVELGDPNCIWSTGATPQFDKGIRHPGIKEGESSQYDSCTTFTPPPVSSIQNVQFNLTLHHVKPVETKYVCSPMTFPSDKKRWITKFQPIVENPAVVHHILIYACNSPVTSESPNCLDMSASCPTIIYAWAVGAKDFCLPENIGIPVGMHGMTNMVMEIHYDNPTLVDNIIDSSGVKMILTDIAPLHEAGILMIGEPGILPVPPSLAPAIQGVRIPPNQHKYQFSTDCPSSCTNQQIPSNSELTVVATFAHAHQSAVAISIDRVPLNGDIDKDVEILIDSPNFDFDLQQIVPLPNNKFKKIYKGDRLRVHCSFDTSKRGDVVTVGGEASDQEMCLGFFVYYPRLPKFPLCLGVAARNLPDDKSSFSACGTRPGRIIKTCGCGTNSSYYCQYGYTYDKCVENRFEAYNNSAYYKSTYDTDEKLMNVVKSHCTGTKTCRTYQRPDVTNTINSRDGGQLTSFGINGCDLTVTGLLDFASVLDAASSACSNEDGVENKIPCDDQICNNALADALNHPCLRDVGSYTLFEVVWPSLYSIMNSMADIITSLGQKSAVIVDQMRKCGICTDSRECTMGNKCNCVTEKVGTSCKCVSENQETIGIGKDIPMNASLFDGFANGTNVTDFLFGNWSTFCEPIAGTTTSVRETWTFVKKDIVRLYKLYSGHKCNKDAEMSTITSIGKYVVANDQIGGKGSIHQGALVLSVVYSSSIKSFPLGGMCSNTCTSWHLNNGRCSDDGMICAYGTDCTDCGVRPTLPNEDLLNPTPQICKDGYQQCLNGDQCVWSTYVCDGWCDCSDGSDEFSVGNGGTCAFGQATYGGTCKSFTSTKNDPSTATLRLLFLPPKMKVNDSDVGLDDAVQMQLLLDRDGPGQSLSYVYRNDGSTVELCKWWNTCLVENEIEGGLIWWQIVLIAVGGVVVGLFFVFVCWKCCSLKDNGVSSQQLEKDKDVEMTVEWMDNVGEVSKKTTVDKLEFNITIK